MKHEYEKSVKRGDRGLLEDALRQAGCRQKGSTLEWHCRFHGEDSRPAGRIYHGDNGWTYFCHACGHKGDWFDIMDDASGAARGTTYKREVDDFNQREKMPVETTYKTIEEMEQRAYGIAGYAKRYLYTDPATNEPSLIVYRYEHANGKKDFKQASPRNGGWINKGIKGSLNPIYNRTGIAGKKWCVVVEGEKCADALIEIGIPATTSPGGAGSAKQADWSPIAEMHVVLWPDNDAPEAKFPRGKGKHHMEDVANLLLGINPNCNIRTIDIDALGMQFKQDAYDFIQREAPNAYASVIDVVRNKAIQHKPKDEVIEFVDRLKSGVLKPLPIPYHRLHRLTKLATPGTVSMVVGEPGAGKSFFIMEMAMFWFDEGIPFAVYELEDDLMDHVCRALSQRLKRACISDREWQSDNSDELKQIIEENREFIDGFRRNITTNSEKAVTYNDMIKWVEQKADAGNKIIVVDPITAASIPDEQYREDQRLLNEIKDIAKTRNVSVILVTHPKKEVKGVVSAEVISGGAAVNRFSHSILWIQKHSPSIESMVDNGMVKMPITHNRTMHVLKSRNTSGQGCRVAMNFGADLNFYERGEVVCKEKKEQASVSLFEERAIANSQRTEVATQKPVEDIYEDDDEELF
jgi:KaiC/GvpD/RAD55 family RecA-like ATPase